MAGRILIVATYNGPRRSPGRPAEFLRKNAQQLKKLRSHIDKTVVVVNDGPSDPEFRRGLLMFDEIMYRPNRRGSYGAWADAFREYPGYDWYFLIEDDYTFLMDDWDQRWIDLWEPGILYMPPEVAVLADNSGLAHAVYSGGMMTAEGSRLIDWSKLPDPDNQLDWSLQKMWGEMFPPGSMKDVRSAYDVVFGDAKWMYSRDRAKPPIIGPVQLLP